MSKQGIYRLALPLFLLVLPGWVQACGEQLPPANRVLVNSKDMVLAFSAGPAGIPVGRHFAIEVQLCPQDGKELATTLRVDADMPAHRHGMNYKTRVRSLGDNRFAVEGLMFHMPGRWRFVFDVTLPSRTLRLTQEITVQ